MTVAELEKAGDSASVTKAYDAAIVYYETAIRKDKKNATLYNKLGLAQLKANDTADARVSFEGAVKKNSKFADALNNLGAVYFVQKNHNAAARYFKKAVALDETRPVFHMNLGAAWFRQNKLYRATAECAVLEKGKKKRVTATWRTSTKTKSTLICGRIRACWRSLLLPRRSKQAT